MTRKRNTWDIVSKVIQQADKVLLFGPAGTGKTTAGVKEGNPNKVYKTTVHEEMPAAELIGHYIPEGDKFVWHDGIAIKAWREGARLVIDEIDRASGDVLTILYGVLDDEAVAALTLPTGETVYPRAGFSCVATMNGQPQDLPAALRDRFQSMVEVPEPAPGAYEALSEDIRALAKASFGGAHTGADKARASSIRSWKSFDLLRRTAGDLDAAIMVFGEHAEEIVDSLSVAAVASSES